MGRVAALAHLRELEFRAKAQQRQAAGVLFRTTLLKAFLSSPAACASTVQNRLDKLAQADSDDADVIHELMRGDP